ncbi:unnamed protein product [Cuscuta campestris]|uniref:Transposase (putative) gypsy type domain-containing protein n=1 Tax=Cuscuta campestris TaxID=132261 RepID=A0A484N1D9_9ASTE|nr:unnamed protein product [Cuscuta campestris]
MAAVPGAENPGDDVEEEALVRWGRVNRRCAAVADEVGDPKLSNDDRLVVEDPIVATIGCDVVTADGQPCDPSKGRQINLYVVEIDAAANGVPVTAEIGVESPDEGGIEARAALGDEWPQTRRLELVVEVVVPFVLGKQLWEHARWRDRALGKVSEEALKNRRWTPSLPFAFFTTVRLQLRCSPDSFFLLSRSVPSLAAMIVSDSDLATPSSNSRQAGQSASDRNPDHTPSPRPSPSAVPGHKRRRLRKQYPSSTPVDEGSRVKLDENIMALCHCQITDRGFADATDMVGPSIEVMRPTSTQTALDAPSGFFTVHLASLKKGLRFPLHPLLIEFLNVVDLLPCKLVPNSHRYIAGYLVRCKDVGVKPTLDHFIFTFKLTKGHKDWASYARRPSFRRIPRPPPDATLLSITRQFCNKGVMNIKEVVTEETLAGLGLEFVQDELRHQPDLLRDIPGGHQPDELKDIPEEGLDCGPFVELQDLGEEMDSDLLLSRFTAGRKRKRETKGQGKRPSSHHEEGPSQAPAVIVVEDQEDATQEPGTMAGQSPPHPVMQGGELAGSSQGIALERPPSPPAVTYEVATGGRSTRLCIPPLPQSLGDVQLETLITLPAEDQARISAGSEDDLDNMWPSVKPPPPPPNPYEDFSEAYEALSANRLPDGRIDWDAPCPLHSLQCMAWESFQDEHLPLLEHECAYYASLERWTSESRTSSPVRPTEEVVLGEELGSPLPRPACHSLPQKTPRRPEVARAAPGSPSSPR